MALLPPDGRLSEKHAERSPCARCGRALLSETVQQSLVVRGNLQARKYRLAGTCGFEVLLLEAAGRRLSAPSLLLMFSMLLPATLRRALLLSAQHFLPDCCSQP